VGVGATWNRAGFSALFLLLGAGCSASSSDAARQENEVQGGANDTGAHNFAVGVTNKLGSVCSGTLIAPNLVLTARHCVVPPTADDSVSCKDTFGPTVPPATLSITTDANIYRAKSHYDVTEIITPTDKAFCGNDIALVLLATNVPEAEAQPAIPVVQFKLTDRRLSGSITALGYGFTNPSATDSGQRRVRQNIPLLCIPGSTVMDCAGDLAKYSNDAREFVTEGYVCAGDSGSGAFDQRTFNKGAPYAPYVLGALSRGPQTADKCLAAIYSRTDAHAQLIVDAGKKAAEQGKYSAPVWTIPAAPSSEGDAPEAACGAEGCADDPAAPPSDAPAASSCSASRARAGGGSAGAALVGLAIASVLAMRRRRTL
jgi:trypsin